MEKEKRNNCSVSWQPVGNQSALIVINILKRILYFRVFIRSIAIGFYAIVVIIQFIVAQAA